MWNRIQQGNDLLLCLTPEELNLADTLDCGQSFRFVRQAEGITGIAHGRRLTARQDENGILFENMTEEDFEQIWADYFDLSRDYDALKTSFCEDAALKKAIAYAPGIRVLRQESFETLISFLISQNNNIPRIKGSIERLCRKFGDPIGNEDFSFPGAERLARLEKADLADLGLGYRDEYILDCARRVTDGRLDLSEVEKMEPEQAREALRTVKGAGPKVAECALLFGFCQTAAFPIDTWMKKVLANYYPGGFPEKYRSVAGIAQQYLFHYIRTCRE